MHLKHKEQEVFISDLEMIGGASTIGKTSLLEIATSIIEKTLRNFVATKQLPRLPDFDRSFRFKIAQRGSHEAKIASWEPLKGEQHGE